MNKLTRSRKIPPILAVAFCLALFGSGCAAPATATQIPTAAAAPQVASPAATNTVIPTPTFTLQPTTTGQEALTGLAGKWIDPDSRGGGTISIIAWQNDAYVVTSVVNTNRGGNELKTSSWANGVLTWEYCPADMQHCIMQNTLSLNGDTLNVNWAWSGGGNSGTSVLQRQP